VSAKKAFLALQQTVCSCCLFLNHSGAVITASDATESLCPSHANDVAFTHCSYNPNCWGITVLIVML